MKESIRKIETNIKALNNINSHYAFSDRYVDDSVRDRFTKEIQNKVNTIQIELNNINVEKLSPPV